MPPALLSILTSNRVFKIGSAIKGDLTRLKKQFPQLASQSSFATIDLKDYAIQRGAIKRKDPGGLDALVEKILGKYLPKDDTVRKSEDWEARSLRDDLCEYAANDVYAARLVFEQLSSITPIDHIQISSPAGTRVALLVQEEGDITAYGFISANQPKTLNGVRVQVPTKSRLVIDIDLVVTPSAAAILHLMPRNNSSSTSKTNSGAYTLGQLKNLSTASTFPLVSSINLLQFDHRNLVSGDIDLMTFSI